MLGFLTGRTGRLVAQGAVLAAVIAGSAVYAALDKSVTLTVDGSSTKVHAFARDVRGLLASQDVAIGERDLVAPAIDTALSDGDKVLVRYARQLRLTVDGEQQVYWTTELTVDAALAALGIRADGARLSASRSAPIGRAGLAMTLSTPKQVTIKADGKSRDLVTTAPTVAQLLSEQSIAVGPLDKLSVVGSAPVVDGLAVKLTRIEKKRITRQERVAYTTVKRSTSKLYKGVTKVQRAGRAGSRTAVYEVVLTDGKVTDRTLVSSTVKTAPVARIVQVGTKARPSTSTRTPSSVGGADGLNWAALAQCESGGNPKAVNPAGPYYGLYQFSLSTWRSVGGSGLPTQNSSAEQTYRAKLLYKKAGAGQWPVCGRRLFT